MESETVGIAGVGMAASGKAKIRKTVFKRHAA